MSTPAIAFIIPAYNSAKTLAKTLESVKAQTRGDWQAIIVDDGSKDTTHEVAQAYVDADPRFSLIRQANGGVSAARNTGVAAAVAPYLCLLDADDWVDPRFIELMMAPLAGQTGRLASYCSYRRVTDDGELPITWMPDLRGDGAKREFSVYCILAVHCVVFAREEYLKIGGMDTTLRSAEDWDFWLKLSFDGLQFVEVRECLGFYYNHPGTLSGDLENLANDILRVLAISRELNAKEPHQDWFNLSGAHAVIWCAALRAAAGKDSVDILHLLNPLPDASGHESPLAYTVMQSLSPGLSPKELAKVIATSDVWAPHIHALFVAFEEASYPGLARNMWLELMAHMVNISPPSQPWIVRDICAFAVDIHSRPNIKRPEGVDSAIVVFCNKGKPKSTFTAPMWGDFKGPSMTEALAHFPLLVVEKLKRNPLALAGFGTRVGLALAKDVRTLASIIKTPGARKQKLKKRLITTVRKILKDDSAGGGEGDSLLIAQGRIEALRAEYPAKPAEAVEAEAADKRQQESDLPLDEQLYWENIFENADPWNYLSPYETKKYHQTMEIITEETVGSAIEVACAEGIFTRMLSPQVDKLLAVDISERALERAAKRCADLTNTSFAPLNLITGTVPDDLDLIVCSEVLYYIDEERLASVGAKFSKALKVGGRLVTAHAHEVNDEPERTGFDWDSRFGVHTIRKAFMETEGLVLEQTYESELYAIHSFRKVADAAAPKPETVIKHVDYGTPLDLDVERYVIWGGAAKLRSAAMASETKKEIPVLMYHRIADDGPEALAPYRTSPAEFEAQLRLLRRHGYYCLSSAELYDHLLTRRPVPGRPILITFDDAYQDFADNAFPILERNNMTAEVFVVTGKVGQTSDWDKKHGVAPLMDWPEIERLSAAGIRFGSHMASHSPAPNLSSDALLDEAMRSKLVLEQRLGYPVTSIAMPYGIFDPRVRQALEVCGYTVAFSTDDGLVKFDDPHLRLPRLEIYGGLPIDDFAKMVGIEA
jgi:peptidoglycan/xylan/chitin deacetylase (PgdA/CDA1 family)/GT2 family glycosyltransferase/ubiquinone/menaquinone biosynthesis C-methylase UbiE